MLIGRFSWFWSRGLLLEISIYDKKRLLTSVDRLRLQLSRFRQTLGCVLYDVLLIQPPNSFYLPLSDWRGRSPGQWGHSIPSTRFSNSQIWPDAPRPWGVTHSSLPLPLKKCSPCFILGVMAAVLLHQRPSDQIWLLSPTWQLPAHLCTQKWS
jgi:hypothetical protein